MSTANRYGRRAFSWMDIFWIIAIIALLISILLPSLARARELAKRAVCAANLKGIGMGMKIYANDNRDWYPTHFFDAKPWAEGQPRDHGITWVGTMGSHDFLDITQPSSTSPHRSHPSRSLFMLIIDRTCSPKQFICPSSGDDEDDLQNRTDARVIAAQPGVNRFDFRGYSSLSYGYQLPYGPHAKPNENSDPRIAVIADKGPYFMAGEGALPGSGTVDDAPSGKPVPTAAGADELLAQPLDFWRPFNSRNHNGEGQCVGYMDGYVEFVKQPITGVRYDNIYTLQSDSSPLGIRTGRIPEPTDTTGPLTDTDSFIVP